MSAARTYDDKKRKGLQEEHLASSSIAEHIEASLSSPFFLSIETPLPESMKATILLASEAPSKDVLSFREAQLTRMRKLAHDTFPTEMEWGKLIPGELRPAACKLRLSP